MLPKKSHRRIESKITHNERVPQDKEWKVEKIVASVRWSGRKTRLLFAKDFVATINQVSNRQNSKHHISFSFWAHFQLIFLLHTAAFVFDFFSINLFSCSSRAKHFHVHCALESSKRTERTEFCGVSLHTENVQPNDRSLCFSFSFPSALSAIYACVYMYI